MLSLLHAGGEAWMRNSASWWHRSWLAETGCRLWISTGESS